MGRTKQVDAQTSLHGVPKSQRVPLVGLPVVCMRQKFADVVKRFSAVCATHVFGRKKADSPTSTPQAPAPAGAHRERLFLQKNTLQTMSCKQHRAVRVASVSGRNFLYYHSQQRGHHESRCECPSPCDCSRNRARGADGMHPCHDHDLDHNLGQRRGLDHDLGLDCLCRSYHAPRDRDTRARFASDFAQSRAQPQLARRLSRHRDALARACRRSLLAQRQQGPTHQQQATDSNQLSKQSDTT